MIFGSFLFGMGQCVSYGQETGCKKFSVRRGSTVLLADRKLVAYSFLFDVAPLRFISIGNYLRMVSYPA
jgi:uncharacterized membrane protein YedE/YeeE